MLLLLNCDPSLSLRGVRYCTLEGRNNRSNEEIQFVDKTDGVIECDSLDLMCRQLEHEKHNSNLTLEQHSSPLFLGLCFRLIIVVSSRGRT